MTKKNIGNDVGALDAIDTFATDFGVEIKGVKPGRPETICKGVTEDQVKKLIHYLAFRVKPKQAAERAGFPAWFCKGKVYRLLERKWFQKKITDVRSKIRERYLAFATDCLPEIAFVEKKLLEKLAENPDGITPTTAKVMRDLKKSAGVLVDEPRTSEFVPMQIAISVQAHLAQQQAAPGQIEADIVDADAE
jgi:hypothetical protein